MSRFRLRILQLLPESLPHNPPPPSISMTPRCLLRSWKSQVAPETRGAILEPEGRTHHRCLSICSQKAYSHRLCGAPGSGVPALHLVESPALRTLPEPRKAKQFTLSILGKQLWVRNLASADTSLLLPASLETVFDAQMGAQKDPGLAFSEPNVEFLMCSCVPF